MTWLLPGTTWPNVSFTQHDTEQHSFHVAQLGFHMALHGASWLSIAQYGFACHITEQHDSTWNLHCLTYLLHGPVRNSTASTQLNTSNVASTWHSNWLRHSLTWPSMASTCPYMAPHGTEINTAQHDFTYHSTIHMASMCHSKEQHSFYMTQHIQIWLSHGTAQQHVFYTT